MNRVVMIFTVLALMLSVLVGLSVDAVGFVRRKGNATWKRSSQVVRGANHYIVCEAKGIYPGAQPYAAVISSTFLRAKRLL